MHFYPSEIFIDSSTPLIGPPSHPSHYDIPPPTTLERKGWDADATNPNMCPPDHHIDHVYDEIKARDQSGKSRLFC